MEAVCKPGILFRFRRPSSIPRRQPSKAMTEALRHLAESEEMRSFARRDPCPEPECGGRGFSPMRRASAAHPHRRHSQASDLEQLT